MKVWTEEMDDAFIYYNEWFSKEKARATLGYVPQLAVRSIVASMIFNKEDGERFLAISSEAIKRLVMSNDLFGEYRLYLFAIGEGGSPKSKVFRHQKLWKKLKRNFDIDNFVLGPEVEHLRHNQEILYASCAEFSIDAFEKAFRIVRRYPTKSAIFFSKPDNILSQEFIKSFLESYYVNGEREGELDYFQLALNLCTQGDLVFRWGSSSEEEELALITMKKVKIQFEGLLD